MIPDADVISTAEPETDEWFATRRGGITATDLPRILGLSQYGNALSVYHDKRGALPPDPGGPAARWGHLLEDIIAETWAADEGFTLSRIGVLANCAEPWMRAAPDRVVHGCSDGPCLAECKNRSAFKAGSWREEMPDDVLAQAAWQRMVSGVDHVHVIVLIGGNDLREFRYDADPDLEAFLILEAAQVWQAVQDGVPPVVDASTALLDLLDRLYPSRDGATVVDRGAYAAIKADYDAACALEKVADAGKTWATYRAVDLLRGGDRLIADDDAVLFTYKPQMRDSTDLELLKTDHPAAYKACVKKKPTKPVPSWKKAI